MDSIIIEGKTYYLQKFIAEKLKSDMENFKDIINHFVNVLIIKFLEKYGTKENVNKIYYDKKTLNKIFEDEYLLFH